MLTEEDVNHQLGAVHLRKLLVVLRAGRGRNTRHRKEFRNGFRNAFCR